MASGSRDRIPPLTLVPSASIHAEAKNSDGESTGENEVGARDLDWSILMARAQGGDGEAYRRLLTDVAPYLQSLARQHHRDPGDAADRTRDPPHL
jgi:RNA polymerase sigma-70 factor (ECF subfamily)